MEATLPDRHLCADGSSAVKSMGPCEAEDVSTGSLLATVTSQAGQLKQLVHSLS